jgi:hypothetical protein
VIECPQSYSSVYSTKDLFQEAHGVDIEKLARCHETIYRCASFLYGPILNVGAVLVLPTPLFDHLENLDRPLAFPADLSEARKKWEEIEKRTERWRSSGPWPSPPPNGA